MSLSVLLFSIVIAAVDAFAPLKISRLSATLSSTQEIPAELEAVKNSLLESTLSDWRNVLGSVPSAAASSLLIDNAPPFIPEQAAWRELTDKAADLSTPCDLRDFLSGSAEMDAAHSKKVNALWGDLRSRESIQNFSLATQLKIKQALEVAYVALWGKSTMRSLEAAISRASGIAKILAEWKASHVEVLTGVLHEVVRMHSKDPAIIQRLTEMFGREVIERCKGYNRLPLFMARKTEYTPLQSENQLQMLVAHTEDYRMLYIRLADRLHTMRHLKSLPLSAEEMHKIALEALYVYAPLAHKMLRTKEKSELEDTAFAVLDVDEMKRTKRTQIKSDKAFYTAYERVRDIVDNDPVMTSHGAVAHVSHRIKGKYQLYLKMNRKGLASPDHVKDALGMRIIIDVKRRQGESIKDHEERANSLCYYLMDKLRSLPGYNAPREGFKDYITNQKENGYQSLHQDFRSPLGTHMEIQIRTSAMHVAAEMGGAAHWYYKDLSYKTDIANSKIYKTAWRSKEQIEAHSPAEMLGLAKKQLLKSRVFVYLEDKSTVLNLKKGATALDAAFAIHTSIGLATTSVFIDGRPARLEQPLRSGSVVVVNCAPGKAVQAEPSWLSIVKTREAQSSLKKYFKQHCRSTVLCMGLSSLLMNLSINEKKIKNKFQGEWPDVDRLARIAGEHGVEDWNSFLLTLGSTVPADEIRNLISRVTGVRPQQLTIMPMTFALLWAKIQNNGWEDVSMQEKLLMPMLREVIPQGEDEAIDFEEVWADMIGRSSLLSSAAAAVEEEREMIRPRFGHKKNSVTVKPTLKDTNSLREEGSGVRGTFSRSQLVGVRSQEMLVGQDILAESRR